MDPKSIDDYEKIREHRNKNNHFARLLGIETTVVREGYAEGFMEYRPDLANPIGVVHGGALFTMIDAIGGSAAASHGIHCATSTITVQYLRPAGAQGKFRCVARELKAGRKISSVQAEIYDEEENLLTVGLCEYVRIESKPIL